MKQENNNENGSVKADEPKSKSVLHSNKWPWLIVLVGIASWQIVLIFLLIKEVANEHFEEGLYNLISAPSHIFQTNLAKIAHDFFWVYTSAFFLGLVLSYFIQKINVIDDYNKKALRQLRIGLLISTIGILLGMVVDPQMEGGPFLWICIIMPILLIGNIMVTVRFLFALFSKKVLGQVKGYTLAISIWLILFGLMLLIIQPRKWDNSLFKPNFQKGASSKESIRTINYDNVIGNLNKAHNYELQYKDPEEYKPFCQAAFNDPTFNRELLLKDRTTDRGKNLKLCDDALK